MTLKEKLELIWNHRTLTDANQIYVWTTGTLRTILRRIT